MGSTYIFKVEGNEDKYIFMADIWCSQHPSDARYIWLPIQFRNRVPYIKWIDSWTVE